MRWPTTWFHAPLVRWVVGLFVIGMALYGLFSRGHSTFSGQVLAFGVTFIGMRWLPVDRLEHGWVIDAGNARRRRDLVGHGTA